MDTSYEARWEKPGLLVFTHLTSQVRGILVLLSRPGDVPRQARNTPSSAFWNHSWYLVVTLLIFGEEIRNAMCFLCHIAFRLGNNPERNRSMGVSGFSMLPTYLP